MRRSGPARQARGNIGVDVDQRLQLFRGRIFLHFDGSLHHKDRDVQDVLANLERLWIVVAFGRAHENRPEPAVEQQGRLHLFVGAIPVGLNFNEFSCRHQQRLRFDFAGRRKLGGASVGCMGHSRPRDGVCAEGRLRAAQVLYGVVFKIGLAAVSICVRNRAKRGLVAKSRHPQENGGVPPAVWLSVCRSPDQRSSCSTLCCDWLASASADTAIDCRVDSAWLLAASSFGSASVRLDAPVCSTLIRLLLKSWRTSTIDRFEPRLDASELSVVEAWFSCANTALAELLSRKLVPAVRLERPSPASLKVTPVIASFEAPVSSNVRFRVSPFRRLMPLKDESCAVVLIFCRTVLYCATRLARVACEFGSVTGAAAVRPAKGLPVPVVVMAPIVDEAALLLVVMLIWPVVLMLACRLFAANAVLSWLRLEIWPAPVPNVMFVAVPPPVAAIDNV